MATPLTRLVMRFPQPGVIPGANRKVAFAFGALHGLCAISLIYPYLGPVINLVPLAAFVFVLRQKMPPEAALFYRFFMQRLGLILLLTLFGLLCLFSWGFHLWPVYYFTLLPLCIADTILVFKGQTGYFFWRGRDAEV